VQKTKFKPNNKVMINKHIFAGGGSAYCTPAIKQLNIRCEAGFQASVGLGDIVEKEGAWDEPASVQE
jgi:hypothetical protein